MFNGPPKQTKIVSDYQREVKAAQPTQSYNTMIVSGPKNVPKYQ